MKFSANLGFLWTDRSLPDAIIAAKAAGFDAVECHWPFDVPSSEVKAALSKTGLDMLGLNTRRGNLDKGENGLSAVPGREVEARAATDEAIIYANEIGAKNIHVMAGFAQSEAARQTFIDNLVHACQTGLEHQINMLIEPLNAFDAPGYFLGNTKQAIDIINDVGLPNLKLMFDCYHVGRTEKDVVGKLKELLPYIGHIQFASVPDRGTPDKGDLDYKLVFSEIRNLGWDKPLGAEYKSVQNTDETLDWMQTLKSEMT